MPLSRTTRSRTRTPGVLTLAALLIFGASSDLRAEELRKNHLTAPIPEPVTIEIRLLQSELNIRPAQTNKFAWWFWGGIIGVAIAQNVDKTRGKHADQLASEIRNLLNGIDYQSSLVQRFESGVNATLMPVIGEVRFTSPDTVAELSANPPESPPELLSIQYSYALIDEFNTLQVTMKAVVWDQGTPFSLDRMADEQVKNQAKYFQVFTYEVTPERISSLKDPNQRAGEWLELGKDKVGALALSGMTTLADALGYDLGSAGTEMELRKANDSGFNGTAKLIQEVDGQKWIRTSSGEITILAVN